MGGQPYPYPNLPIFSFILALYLALALPLRRPNSIALPYPILQLTTYVRAQGPFHPRI